MDFTQLAMKNRLLINALLLLLLVGLGLFVWLNPHTDKPQKQQLTQLNEHDVQVIKIHRADKPDIVLQKQKSKWEMTSPYHFDVASHKVKLLLTLLHEPINAEYSIEGKNLEQYQLSPEKVSIQFNDEDKIIFGMSNPISYDRYIRRNNKILLISETVYSTLTADAASFFKTNLIPKGRQIAKIELPKGYQSKDDTPAKWQLIQAVQVFGWNPDKEPSQAVVHIHLDNGDTIDYEIIQHESELWLGNRKLQAKYQIADENREDLLPQ